MSKCVVVTGASRGIGRQIALDFALSGYKVIANYNKSEKEAEDLKNEIISKGGICEIFRADVSKENEVKALFEFAVSRFGYVDVLINNAGISKSGLINTTSLEEWNEVINTNLTSVFLCSREAINIMLQKHEGVIINIASVWGVSGASYEGAYSASKGAIITLTQALAKENGPSGIRVNAISPGVIDTDMNKCYSKEEMEELIDDIPLGRIGKCRDISKTALFLAGDDASYITGQNIIVDGGFLL
ncbi:MAG: SDR family oxidoreductase [Clostridia bacterium]|nr:SDR family oxidoreductase [Clostridia bacterium]